MSALRWFVIRECAACKKEETTPCRTMVRYIRSGTAGPVYMKALLYKRGDDAVPHK